MRGRGRSRDSRGDILRRRRREDGGLYHLEVPELLRLDALEHPIAARHGEELRVPVPLLAGRGLDELRHERGAMLVSRWCLV